MAERRDPEGLLGAIAYQRTLIAGHLTTRRPLKGVGEEGEEGV